MYKSAVRWMIRRNIAHLNAGDYRPSLAMFADDALFRFPGDNSWAAQFRPISSARAFEPTHKGKAEIEQFMQRFVENRLRLDIEDILVNGPPWNTRVAARAKVSAGDDTNRAVLFVTARWGKLRTHEDFIDTERTNAFDRILAQEAGQVPV